MPTPDPDWGAAFLFATVVVTVIWTVALLGASIVERVRRRRAVASTAGTTTGRAAVTTAGLATDAAADAPAGRHRMRRKSLRPA
jgi:hypothetical protein